MQISMYVFIGYFHFDEMSNKISLSSTTNESEIRICNHLICMPYFAIVALYRYF